MCVCEGVCVCDGVCVCVCVCVKQVCDIEERACVKGVSEKCE